MNDFLRHAWRRALRRLGVPGVVGFALLLPTLVIAWWMPRVDLHREETASTIAAKEQAVTRQGQPIPRRAPSAEQVVEFTSRFPPLNQSSKDLERLFALANDRKVNLLKGDYQLKPEPNTSLVSFTGTFPVRNEYGSLKAFAADVLRAMPNVSMDELRMARPDAGSRSLDVVIRFTFVYRSP